MLSQPDNKLVIHCYVSWLILSNEVVQLMSALPVMMYNVLLHTILVLDVITMHG